MQPHKEFHYSRMISVCIRIFNLGSMDTSCPSLWVDLQVVINHIWNVLLRIHRQIFTFASRTFARYFVMPDHQGVHSNKQQFHLSCL